MAVDTVRRLASGMLKVGESKIRFAKDSLSKIQEALTREDVRALIKEGAIYAISPRGVSRAKGRNKQRQLKKGRRFGAGSKKGTIQSRRGKKDFWMKKVRAQRNYLRSLAEAGKLPHQEVRKIYLMIKGNAFRGVKALETYLKDNKLLKQ
ncbi:MAG: 50S ribosomal protein L19e [Candidatus Micrarchaeota archaeon]|nr:50S ribosomal protein L19e [Candidatus Micrarchaeota archaeon]